MATSSTSTSNPRNEYKMTSNPRGFCLLINNEFFDEKSPREGTAKDKQELKEAFETLGFRVVECDNQAAEEMEKRLREISAKDHSSLDCFVCCILSHGDRDVIEGTDGVLVPIDKLKSAVKGGRCPSLQGKPKVFVIQACSGTKEDKVRRDGSGPTPTVPILPSEADFLILQSTVPGYTSYRYEDEGSPFIQILSRHLKRIQERTNIHEIMTRVIHDMAGKTITVRGAEYKQCPVSISTLRLNLMLDRQTSQVVPPKPKTDSSDTPSVENKIQRIADMNESQTSWSFKARVVFKGQKLPWKTDKKKFRFNVTFQDASGTVRAVAFNDNINRFMKELEYLKVYKVTGMGGLKRENQQLEIYLYQSTVVEECADDGNIPRPALRFVPFDRIADHLDAYVDIMGVVRSVEPKSRKRFKSDKGKKTPPRKVELVDKSLKRLSLALWGPDAEQFNGSGNPVIAVKNAKVTSYNGICSVSKPAGSQLLKNKGIPGAEDLRDWYKREGHSKDFTEIRE